MVPWVWLVPAQMDVMARCSSEKKTQRYCRASQLIRSAQGEQKQPRSSSVSQSLGHVFSFHSPVNLGQCQRWLSQEVTGCLIWCGWDQNGLARGDWTSLPGCLCDPTAPRTGLLSLAPRNGVLAKACAHPGQPRKTSHWGTPSAPFLPKKARFLGRQQCICYC